MTPLQPGPLSPGMVSLLTAGHELWLDGRKVKVVGVNGHYITYESPDYYGGADYTRFRLVDEATGEYRDAVRAANKLTDDEIWGSSAAPIPPEPVADRWADLERLAKAATPGPWSTCVRMGGDAIVDAPTRPVARVDYRRDEADRDRDAAFIAAANPSTVLELIAAARAKEAGE